MPIQIEIPTGAELHRHIEAWEALPKGVRPDIPVQWWVPSTQKWSPMVGRRFFPDDDTPQPGLRLVTLPDPAPATERIQWWEARGRTLPSGFVIDAVGQAEDMPDGYVYASSPKHHVVSAAPDGTVKVLMEVTK